MHNGSLSALLLLAALTTVSPAWGQVISEDSKILPIDGNAGDAFGHSVAINDGIAIFGANSDDTGSAYIRHLVFDKFPMKLLPNDGVTNDLFAHSVAIGSGSTLGGDIRAVVGAPNHNAFGPSSGAAYLFSDTGVQFDKFLPSDGAAEDHFGHSVAIGNGIVAVGSPDDDDNGLNSGSVYLYSAGTGMQIHKLTANDGGVNDSFGHAVAISNGVVAIAAPRHRIGTIEVGAVYLFNASTGAQLAKLTSSEGVPFEQFGYSVAIDNGKVAIGALATETAYVFDANTHAQLTKIATPSPGNAFGWSIDIDAQKLVVGALLDPFNGLNSGGAYLYNANTGASLASVLPSDGAILEQFGSAVAIDNDELIIGARNDNDNGTGSGSGYYFDIFCPADLDGDGDLDIFDVFTFLNLFNIQDPAADFNNDSVFDIFDVFAFLDAFNAGCP